MATAAVTNAFVTATTIAAGDFNTNFSDLVTFLNNSVVHRDGSKAMTAALDLGGFTITSLGEPSNSDDAATKNYVDSLASSEVVQDLVGAMFTGNTESFVTVTYQDADGTIDVEVTVLDEDDMASDDAASLATQQSIKAYADTKLSKAGGTMTGAIAMGTSQITGLGDPTSAQDAATKNYVDGLAAAEVIQDLVGAMVTGNTETFITVTYQDADGTIDFVVPVKDEDTMSSDSAAHVPTQQSVKAYVDTQIASVQSAAAADGDFALTNDNASVNIGSTGTTSAVTKIIDGDWVVGHAEVKFLGTGIAADAGQDFYLSGLPTPSSNYKDKATLGSCLLYDSSLSTPVPGVIVWDNPNSKIRFMQTHAGSDFYDNGDYFSVATGDIFSFQYSYEID
jgi:hypothetical protein